MANGMTIKINTDDGMKEFSAMEMWNQAYNDYRYTNTFFDQLKEYTSTIGTVETNIVNNLLLGRLDRYFKTTNTRPGTIARTSTAGFKEPVFGAVSTPMIQSKVKFTYPTVIRVSDSGRSGTVSITTSVIFVYPSVK
jgi:hypothetical protein